MVSVSSPCYSYAVFTAELWRQIAFFFSQEELAQNLLELRVLRIGDLGRTPAGDNFNSMCLPALARLRWLHALSLVDVELTPQSVGLLHRSKSLTRLNVGYKNETTAGTPLASKPELLAALRALEAARKGALEITFEDELCWMYDEISDVDDSD